MKLSHPTTTRFFGAMFFVLFATALAHSQEQKKTATTEPRPLHIIAFGAHPDDAGFQIGGAALK